MNQKNQKQQIYLTRWKYDGATKCIVDDVTGEVVCMPKEKFAALLLLVPEMASMLRNDALLSESVWNSWHRRMVPKLKEALNEERSS